MTNRIQQTVVIDSPTIFRGGKLTCTIALKGHWLDRTTQRELVTANTLAAIVSYLLGNEEQAAAWLEDAVTNSTFVEPC